MAAQQVEHVGEPRDAPGAGVDTRRLALVTAYGGAFVGPLGHGWYELLDRVTTRIWAPGTPRCIAAKIAADTVVFGPIHVASACARRCAAAPRAAAPLRRLRRAPRAGACSRAVPDCAGFFGLMGLAGGESQAVIAQRFRDKFWPTLLAESVAWPLVQGINFWRVPVQHQLLVVNVVSLADCTFLSWVKHQGDTGRWRQLLQGGPFGP